MIAALLWLLVMLASLPAQAQIDVDATLDGQRLDMRTTYLIDPSSAFTLEDVQRVAHVFVPPGRAGLNFGLTDDVPYWIRIPVRNRSAERRAWMLEIGYPLLDQITLYLPGPDGTERREAGDLRPFGAREYEHHNFIFSLEEPPHSQRVLYLRVVTRGVLDVPLRAWEEQRFTEHHFLEWTVLFAFYGITLMMAAYNLGLFALSRLPEYGLFAVVVLAEGFSIVTSYGHAYQFLFPTHPYLAQRIVPFSWNLAIFANCLFASHQVHAALPRWVRRMFPVLIPLTALCSLLTLVVPFPFMTVLVQFCYFVLIPFAVVVAVSWRLSSTGPDDVPSSGWANAMLVGWVAACLGVACTGLTRYGFLPIQLFTIWGFLVGATVQFVLITAGLSSRLRWLQRALAKVSGELQQRVAELGLAIDLTQTEVARTEAAERARSEVVATMTHELRTPLNAIVNIPAGLQQSFPETAALCCEKCAATFVLEEGEQRDRTATCPQCGAQAALSETVSVEYVGDPEHSLRYLAIIEKSGRHLLQVINRILEPSANSKELDVAPLDAVALLSEVVEQMGTVAAQSGVGVRLEVAASSLWLAADSLRLRQILINLIGNAIKFSDAKSTVTVSARLDNTHVVFSVKDEGIGIPKHKHAAIFETFEQVHDPALRRVGGTGLGLSIVRSLVRLHGGEVWLESEVGRGTTFHFSLPLRDQIAA